MPSPTITTGARPGVARIAFTTSSFSSGDWSA